MLGPLTSQTDFSSSNNRIIKSGYSYDNARNLTAEPSKSYVYDAENRLTSAIASGVTTTYVYDGEGRRVRKNAGGVITRMIYNHLGQLIAEYNDSGSLIKEYVYKGSELLASYDASRGAEYATADHLGSPRLWTNSSGQVIAGGRHDYLPFGEELFAGVANRTTVLNYPSTAQADGKRHQFTSKERDRETNLDYFGTRYYSSAQGQFTSPDAPLIDQWGEDPQSWNLYAYVRNNPLRFIDPTGQHLELTGDEETRKKGFERIKKAIGDQYAQYLSVVEGDGKKGMKKGHFYVIYSGAKLDAKKDTYATPEQQIAAWITGVISHKDTLEFQVTEKYKGKDGKEYTLEDSGSGKTLDKEDSSTGNYQVFVHPNAGEVAMREGPRIAPSLSGVPFTNEDVDLHEIGHAHAQMLRGWDQTDRRNRNHAVLFENYSRWRRERQQGLPLGSIKRRGSH